MSIRRNGKAQIKQLEQIIEKFEDKPEFLHLLWAEEAGLYFEFRRDERGRIQIQICKDEQPIATATFQRHHSKEVAEIFNKTAAEYENRFGKNK